MSARERVATVLRGGIPDRVPINDKFWPLTEERWRAEGLPPGVSAADFVGANELTGIAVDYSMQFPVRPVHTGEARTYWDGEGALRRDMRTDHGWTSQWLDYTIKSRDDWHLHRQQLAFNPSRILPGTKERYDKARARGRFVCFQAHGCFHPTWMRVGMVQLLMLMLDDPEWVSDMFAAHTQMLIESFEALWAVGVKFDAGRIADDLGSGAAPMISPALYDTLVKPHHKRLCDHFASRALPSIARHRELPRWPPPDRPTSARI